MSEKMVNDALAEMFESYERSLPRKNNRVRRAVERARLLIADIIAKHTDSDGTIPRNKVSVIMQEIAKIEPVIYRELRDELRNVLDEAAEYSSESIIQTFVEIYGLATLAGIVGVEVAFLEELGEEVAEVLFNLFSGRSRITFRDSVVQSSFNRTGEDGLKLIDRIRNLSTSFHKELADTVREGIRKGEGSSDILRRVEKTFKNMGWRLDTITETETMYVLRQTVARFAEESGMVKAVRIVDFMHGDPAIHRKHMCYIYANQDEHGLGTGVYPIGTRKIRNPHPRCRSILLYVMKDELA